MRKTKILNGKLSSASQNFAFSGIDETTRLLVFINIKENFDFNTFLSIINFGVTVGNKFNIQFDKGPKIVITSNFYLQEKSNSFRRRIIEFDFTDYFIVNPPHDKKFQHLLFDGWDDDEWNHFYNFMIKCVSFLKISSFSSPQ